MRAKATTCATAVGGLRGPVWAIDDGDARDSTEGSGRRPGGGGYLVESKRLGVPRIGVLIPP